MYTCRGCGYTGEKVSHYMGLVACSKSCAKRAWQDRHIKATREYRKILRGV